MFDCLLNLIYPDTCFLCSAPTARRQDCGVCASCWQKALELKIVPPVCLCCGLPFHNFGEDAGHLCGNCLLEAPAFSAARSFGYYTGEMATLIQGLKFQGRRNLTALLAPLLARTLSESWEREEFDLIVPVPLHPRRRRNRGYNQSGLLAQALSAQIAVPFGDRALRRIRPTLPQVGLSNPQRLENVRKAFVCPDPPKVSGKRILLVDDVITTGATTASAAQALLRAGCFRVSVLTVARALP
jgi:ComF family protein